MTVISRLTSPGVVRRIIRRLTPPFRSKPLPQILPGSEVELLPLFLESTSASPPVTFDASDASPAAIAHLLGFLWDDLETLRACSLTCRLWREVAQSLIYRSICIGSREDLHHFENVVMFVPKTRPWISEVRFSGGKEPGYGPQQSSWVSTITQEFASRLPNVVTMQLCDFSDRNSVPDETFIRNLVLFSDVRYLEINECVMSEETLWSIVSAFPRLRHLTIRNFRCMKHRGQYNYPPHSIDPQAEQAKGPVTGLPFLQSPRLYSLKVVQTTPEGMRPHYELQSTLFRFARSQTITSLRSFTWISLGDVDYVRMQTWSINCFLYELQNLEHIDMKVPLGIPVLRRPDEPDQLSIRSVHTCHWYDPDILHNDGRFPEIDGSYYFPNVTTLVLHIPETPFGTIDWDDYRALKSFIDSPVWYPDLRCLDVYAGFTWESDNVRAAILRFIFESYGTVGRYRVNLYFKLV